MGELHDAVNEAYEAGILEPALVAEWVIANRTSQWLKKSLAEEARELIAEYARGVTRRTNHIAAPRMSLAALQEKGYTKCESIINEPKLFAPEIGWKLARDCSPDDLLTVAAYKRSQARPFLVVADELEAVALEMRELGIKKLGRFPAGMRQLLVAA